MSKPGIIELRESHVKLLSEMRAKIKRREAVIVVAFQEMADEIMNDVLRTIKDELMVDCGCLESADYSFDQKNNRFVRKWKKPPGPEPPQADKTGGCPAGIKTED